jgi:hypothetical protein
MLHDEKVMCCFCNYYRKLKEAPHFPTYYPEDEEPLAEEIYSENLHPFNAPTITYEEHA